MLEVEIMRDKLIVVILLLIQFYLRGYNITVQHPYVDEGAHTSRAVQVWDFDENPGRYAHGKVLLYYWLGLFETKPTVALPIVRLAIALFSLLGGAALFVVGRMLAGRLAGLMALALYAIMPLAVFFGRMALADPFVATFGCVVAWRSLVFARYPSMQQGVILGVLLGLTTLAKLTLGLLPLLPVGAALLFYDWQRMAGFAERGREWLRLYLPPLILAAVIVAIMWMPLVIPAWVARDSDEPFVLLDSPVAQREDDEAAVNPLDYAKDVWPVIEDFTTRSYMIVVGLTLVVGLILSIRLLIIGSALDNKNWLLSSTLFLGLWLVLTTALILFKARLPVARYFTPMAAPTVTILACGFAWLWRIHWSLRGVLLFMTGWWLWFALPFDYTIITAPLELPFRDLNAINHQSGILNGDEATSEAGALLQSVQADLIVANWRECYNLYFYVDQEIVCLDGHELVPDLRVAVNEQLRSGETAYLVTSGTPPLYNWIDGLEGEAIQSYPRRRFPRSVDVWRMWWAEDHGS